MIAFTRFLADSLFYLLLLLPINTGSYFLTGPKEQQNTCHFSKGPKHEGKKERYMSSKHKPIPQFNSEDEEREFWATHDSSEYLDWNKAERNPTFSRLKPSTRTVSIRLPESMIAALKTLANKRDVPYQSLVKIFLAEKIKEETSMQHNPQESK